MNRIDLDSQGEAVKQFFLDLPADPEGAIVEVNGRALARLVPIRAAEGHRADGSEVWTKEQNARRCFLIDREIDGTLSPEEAAELAVLQREMLDYIQRVAPLPLDATRRLHDELLARAEGARNG